MFTSEAPAPLRATSLSYVALQTPSVDAMQTFYTRALGLVPHSAPPEVSARLGWGVGHHALDLIEGTVGLAHFGLEVRDEGGYQRLGERLSQDGHEVVELSGAPPALSLRDPDGNVIHLHGPIDRGGEYTADSARRPIRVQHVTLTTAAMEPMVAFYESLGFSVSDRMADTFTWLRCNTEHHVVAIVRGAQPMGLDHYSYDLATWSDFKSWCDRLTEIGIPVQWGPGRHGPGNNLFIFVDDPDGNHVELSAEMEHFWDDRVSYRPRSWVQTPGTINLWGGQLASWRHT